MKNNLLKRIITSLFLIIILFSSLYHSSFGWKMMVIFFLLVCFYEFYNLIIKIGPNKVYSVLFIMFIGLYSYFLYFLLINLRSEFNEEVILILILTCILSDIGGYCVGKLIGGPKLISISPNKTVAGAFGSIIFTVIGTLFFLQFLDNTDSYPFILEYSLQLFIWLIMMSIYCQIGDLLISYLKRKAKLKHTGNLLPGHGGILDRVDGIIFAIPLGVLTYYFLF